MFISTTNKMAAPLRKILIHVNKSNSQCFSIPLIYSQKRWHGRRKLIYRPDGAHHVPGIPVHPDRKFPQVPDTYSEVADYPPIKPKFPPGSWGNLDRHYSWLWHTIKEEAAIKSGDSKNYNLFTGSKANAIILDPINSHPMSLKFREYVTKTHMISDTEEQNPDETYGMDEERFRLLLDKVTEDIKDHLILENGIIEREELSPSVESNMKCKMLFRCIADSIFTFFQKDFEHLLLCNYDEDVKVSAFWQRFGVDKSEVSDCPQYTNVEEMLKIITDMNQTVVSEVVFDAMVRCQVPLNQLVEVTSELCSAPAPQMPYRLASYGHRRRPNTTLKPMCAGQHPGRGYQAPPPADPAGWGLVACLNTAHAGQEAGEAVLGGGLTAAFTWLTAQAQAAGFGELSGPLPRPLVAQLVMTDGHCFSFLKYQLNSLALWRDDAAAGSPANLCWHSAPRPLYTALAGNKVDGLSEAVIRRLVGVFVASVAPADVAALLTGPELLPRRVEEAVVEQEEQYIV